MTRPLPPVVPGLTTPGMTDRPRQPPLVGRSGYARTKRSQMPDRRTPRIDSASGPTDDDRDCRTVSS